jgi:riboflavin kinase/FMN adenylyltransferase
LKVLSWNNAADNAGETLQRSLDRPVRLTIGVFDGVHMGHRKLIHGILEGPTDAVPLVVTFRQSPVLLVSPGHFPGFLHTFEQKMSLLESLGVGAVVVIDFSEEMRNLSGRAFIGLLKENLTIQKIVVGQNFRFGKSRISGTDDLKEMLSDTGIEVQVTEPVLWDGRIVSSTRIRASIIRGDFAGARSMLTTAYALDLRGVPGRAEGSGRRVIARSALSQVVPQPGRYAVTCIGRSGEQSGHIDVREDVLTLTADECSGITMALFT